MKFCVPVTIQTTGWIQIDAEDEEGAKEVALHLNDIGVSEDSLFDSETVSEVNVEDLHEIDAE
jgi:hypothetical protein